MAAGLNFGGSMLPFVGTLIKIGAYFIGGGLLIGFVFVLGKFYTNKKSFNIPVTIWIPRSDNKLVDEVSGKGGYFKQGVDGITTFRLKRKGVKMIEIPPPASRFLVGLRKHLFLVQKGMNDFEPVLPESFMTVQTPEKNKAGKFVRKAVVNLKCINQDATAWSFDNAESAKRRFTFSNFWNKYKDFIQITIFILIVFVASYIQYNALKEVAASLRDVAEVLGPAVEAARNAPIVT